MMTIVFDNFGVASDGLTVMGDRIVGRDTVKVRSRPRMAIYAITGFDPMFDAAIKWFEAGADPEKMPGKSPQEESLFYTFMVLSSHAGNGRLSLVRFTSDCHYPEQQTIPFAAGAGADYAFGALWAGASALQAVEVVAANTNSTGGRISYLPYDEVFIPITTQIIEPVRSYREICGG